MNIAITVIPHKDQRYPTCGDWQFDKDGNLQIRVSDCGHWLHNFLIARHELDEAILCKANGVTQEQVDKYDLEHPEAGDDCFSHNMDAPYSHYHNLALAAEYQMASNLEVRWDEYTDAVEKLFEGEQDGNEAG